MPLPLIPLITAGAGLIGQGINALSTKSANKSQLEYNRELYDKQRRDALGDWTMQNEYNSPKAQMDRFKAAGLNPNLIYGQMTQAQPVRSVSGQGYNPEVPKVDLGTIAGNTLSSYYDTKLKQAQINNLEAQNSVILQEAMLKSAQTLNIGTSTEKTAFDLAMANQLKETSLQAAQASLKNIEAQTAQTLTNTETQIIMRQSNLTKAVEEIANLRIQRAKSKEEIQQIKSAIDNMKKSGELQNLDINLKKNGVQPGDPLYLRMIQQIFGDKINSFIKKFK